MWQPVLGKRLIQIAALKRNCGLHSRARDDVQDANVRGYNSKKRSRFVKRLFGRTAVNRKNPLWERVQYQRAEREGFEPPVPLRVLRISSATHSTSLASLHK